jgi:hypothetical protein
MRGLGGERKAIAADAHAEGREVAPVGGVGRSVEAARASLGRVTGRGAQLLEGRGRVGFEDGERGGVGIDLLEWRTHRICDLKSG